MPCSAPLRFRIADAGDRGALRAFLERLSPNTIKLRYLTPAVTLAGELGEHELHRLIGLDDESHLVVLAVDGSEVRGVGEFFKHGDDDAELALLVEDAFQDQGIGRCLFGVLEQLALERGLRAFTAEVAYGNARMRSFLRTTGRQLQTQIGYGSLHFRLLLEAA